jgi:diketogulonate reductase-like aldo/keto reductase
VIVTTSSKKERLEGYLAVGDIDLTNDDVKAIDKAGTKGQKLAERRELTVKALRWITVAGLTGYIVAKAWL